MKKLILLASIALISIVQASEQEIDLASSPVVRLMIEKLNQNGIYNFFFGNHISFSINNNETTMLAYMSIKDFQEKTKGAQRATKFDSKWSQVIDTANDDLAECTMDRGFDKSLYLSQAGYVKCTSKIAPHIFRAMADKVLAEKNENKASNPVK